MCPGGKPTRQRPNFPDSPLSNVPTERRPKDALQGSSLTLEVDTRAIEHGGQRHEFYPRLLTLLSIGLLTDSLNYSVLTNLFFDLFEVTGPNRSCH